MLAIAVNELKLIKNGGFHVIATGLNILTATPS